MTSRSASSLSSRRTWRIDQPSNDVQRLAHPGVKGAQAGVLDLVLARDLAHDQLRVADQLDLVGAELAGALDPEQQGAVLGDVVGRLADPLAGAPRAPPRPASLTTAAIAAGPGLPRAPPSTCTVSRTAVSAQPALAGAAGAAAASSRRVPSGPALRVPRRSPASELGDLASLARSRAPPRSSPSRSDLPLVPGELPGDGDPHAPAAVGRAPRPAARPASGSAPRPCAVSRLALKRLDRRAASGAPASRFGWAAGRGAAGCGLGGAALGAGSGSGSGWRAAAACARRQARAAASEARPRRSRRPRPAPSRAALRVRSPRPGRRGTQPAASAAGLHSAQTTTRSPSGET